MLWTSGQKSECKISDRQAYALHPSGFSSPSLLPRRA